MKVDTTYNLNLALFKNYSEFFTNLLSIINHNNKIIWGYLNAYTYLKYRKIEFPCYFYFISDGLGINIANNFLNVHSIKFSQRFVSTDLWEYCLENMNKKGVSCYFYGGKRNYENILEKNLRAFYPDLKIAGIKNGYDKIDASQISADVLFLGLGTPLQEEWALKNFDNLKIPVVIMVGSAIDFWSGAKKRAPLFFRKAGLEWFYRLFSEPLRLWKRYIIGAPFFIFFIIIQKVKLLFIKKSK